MFEFELPDLGEGVAEGELLAWHVAPGDRVEGDQVLAEVETDKAAVDVPSPVAGVVRDLHYEPGEMVATGSVFVSIATDEDSEAERSEASQPASGEAVSGEAERSQVSDSASGETASSEGEQSDAEATEGTSAKGGRVFAPPNVRRLARELGVDITTVDGSGPSSRIAESDVRAAAKSDEGEDETESDTRIKSAVSRVDSEDERTEPAKQANGDAASSEANGGETAVKSAVSTVDSTADREQTLATPATRKVADELGVDIDAIPTDEMRDGKPYVDEGAVRAYADRQAAQASTAEASEPATSEAEQSEPSEPVSGDAASSEVAVAETADTEAAITTATADERREPYQGIRRTIGERMAQSRREIPHATHHDRAAVEGLVAARQRLEPLAEERGVRLTYTALLLKCVAAALESHPILNTELDTDGAGERSESADSASGAEEPASGAEIVYHDAINIGVATATDHGLVVPVVENVAEKGLLALAREINDLVERARERDLHRDEMQGGTFTVTNFGAIGGEYADPIINVPQTAILGTGALKERPVAEDGEVVAKPTLPLSLAIDHRVVDGADAARFVNTLKEYLTEPSLLLLE